MPTLTAELTPEYRFSPHQGIPRYCTSILNRLCDCYWEARFNIRTAKGAWSHHHDARPYGALAYDTYFRIFDFLKMQPRDVVADIGSGKGRVVCVAATYPIAEAIGVEIDPALSVAANENAAKMRGARAPMRFVCQSATEFDYDPVNTLVFISPFGEETMGKVLSRVEESLQKRPRTLRIAYGNPVLSSLLAEKRWLKLFECWRPSRWSRVKFPVHFYRTVAAFMATVMKRLQEVTEVAEHCPIY